MASADFLSGEAFESEGGLDAFLESDEWADAFEEMEAYAEELGDLDGFEEEADGYSEMFAEEDLFEEGLDDLDGFEGFEQDEASGLYLPGQAPRLVSGPAAVVLARGLNPFVLESMDADDAEAFFRRIARGVRGAVRTVGRVARTAGRVARTVGRVAAPLLRRAAPLLRRALPIIQRVAGVAGPWGRVISAGIGAAQGLLEGRGLRGALAGAVGGLVPGVGGRIASSILGADGADDDAALDALADMADARQVPPAVALPMGAGLAARVVCRQAVRPGTPLGAASQGVLRSRSRATEQTLMRAALQVPGSAGQRLRLMRGIAQRAALQLRRRDPQQALTLIPRVVRAVCRRVLAQAAHSPGLGAVDPRTAAQRVAVRQQVLRRVPVARLGAASIRQAVQQA
ncbi:hypothetical protein [Vitiosangium sp. GDMCC 1.1324]|uniref:hypothetical protein n=1 Tax=Vitiosangium sp. (strain GDMCC 1.1324) TaxID=2138576 RepID=UPI000D3C68E2|nr:hypothetical protein [Vitiosangium sp. GDMCC 1.1324]PTL81225.1 hypothetical protein DAT35_24195 [Vitiosangium sp. GDMCC 1.1324]